MAGIKVKKILSFFKPSPAAEVNSLDPQASGVFGGGYRMIKSLYFDGEKTPYELGSPVEYIIDYHALRARAWQAFLESDVVQNAIKKYALWIVGSGLKLQAQPDEVILQGIDLSRFIRDAESRFRIFANETFSTFANMQSVNTQAVEALTNAINAGDVLCIIRYDGKIPTLQIIDGEHVRQPFDDKVIKAAQGRGNTIRQGVEINKKGTHIAYYVYDGQGGHQRIEARGRQTKRVKAWLFYGAKHKISDVRGTSLLSAVLETAAKMDRYKDATLGSAEENAKIPYTIEHTKDSTGEDITAQQVAQAFGKGKGLAPETDSYVSCETNGIAGKVAQTTSKTTYNMPIGSTLKRNAGNTDMHFGEFFGVNMDIVYATIGIPPEVALDKFGGAYSGSRAALKSWEYKMLVDRVLMLKNQYYKPFYDFWLDINILDGTIQASGYLAALDSGDLMFLAAYRNARFIGAPVPHIDPLKEVSAERAKLGISFEKIPLTTVEQSTEALNTGDADQVLKKAQNEKDSASYFDTIRDVNGA